MSGLLPNLRYERKFLAPQCGLTEVVAVIRRHPAAFREIFPPRVVNNIYLDSAGLQDYQDHVHGVPDRLKTRIRWYGMLAGEIDAPVLEQKIKRGLVSGKTVRPLFRLRLNGSDPRDEIDAMFRNTELPDSLRLALRQLQPSLVNRYERRYFVSANGHFRITTDVNITFTKLVRRLGAFVAEARLPGVVVELKYDPHFAEESAVVANALPFRLARCSKYVAGIEALRAHWH